MILLSRELRISLDNLFLHVASGTDEAEANESTAEASVPASSPAYVRLIQPSERIAALPTTTAAVPVLRRARNAVDRFRRSVCAPSLYRERILEPQRGDHRLVHRPRCRQERNQSRPCGDRSRWTGFTSSSSYRWK